MAVPKEYNVQGSLNGLSPDILNEVLDETLYAKDAQNLVGVSKQTLKLIDHPRFMNISEKFIHYLVHGLNVPNKTQYGTTIKEDGHSDGTSFVHINSNNNWCTVTVDPIVENGISKVEFVFEGHEQQEFCLGIAEASEIFIHNYGPEGCADYWNESWDYYDWRKPFKPEPVYWDYWTSWASDSFGDVNWAEIGQDTIRFISSGDLQHLIKIEDGFQVSFPANGNQKFYCGQRVSIEVDMNSIPSKVVFFINGDQQKNYVTGIPDKIRFFAFVQQAGSSFHITRSESLRQSSARIDADSVAWKWGENWKRN